MCDIKRTIKFHIISPKQKSCKAAMILCIFCMLLFVLFRMTGKQILFSDIDVIRLLFLDRLNLLQYTMVMMKYIAYSYLISVISEILLNKKELIKEGVV